MKKIAILFTALLLLASCSKGYKVTVTFPDDSANGETAFLTNYDTGDTLLSATVENNACTFEGNADKGFFARLLVGGNRYGFIVEPGDVKLNIAEGTAISPINDKMAAWSKDMQAIAEDSTLTEAESDARYAEELFKFYQGNKDNAIGPWAFCNYLMYKDFTEADIDAMLKEAPAEYAQLKRVAKAKNAARQLAVTAVGQKFTDFEVVIVDDGSTLSCREVVQAYEGKLDVRYYFKPNSGPGQTRNYGAERAKGDYLLILDSDILIPEGYFEAVEHGIEETGALAFGGPDRAHTSFSPIQKAINYSMTSFFTTGGIRGGKKKMDKFYPRSFNMGVKREVYLALGGFSKMRFGEDIDFSIRLFKAGYECRLFSDAWVFHKRRTDFRKFFKQVHNSGIARINLYKKYPESLKLSDRYLSGFGFFLIISHHADSSNQKSTTIYHTVCFYCQFSSSKKPIYSGRVRIFPLRPTL